MIRPPSHHTVSPDLSDIPRTLICLTSCPGTRFFSPESVRKVAWAEAGASRVSWDLENAWAASIHLSTGSSPSFLQFPDNGSARGQLSCRLPGQCTRKCYRNHGDRKRQVALKDAEQQGLFSTGAGSAESPPKAECPGFVLSVFHTG